MPVPFGITKSKFLHKDSFGLKVGNHLFNRDIIITDGRCFSITFYTYEIEFHNESGLMGLGPF